MQYGLNSAQNIENLFQKGTVLQRAAVPGYFLPSLSFSLHCVVTKEETETTLQCAFGGSYHVTSCPLHSCLQPPLRHPLRSQSLCCAMERSADKYAQSAKFSTWMCLNAP